MYEGGLVKSVTDEEYKSPKKTRPVKASDYIVMRPKVQITC